ncbi:TetR/AcrR family transcriptional regulator [Polycladidibacter stylochi]|uniref:TetR/AcrR family transcriptional regulator n=1 Tax=Polycladidibacter stylochi TaxID=1807766 RepID=UPI00082BA2A1|nr:TetR/AcrR family transcriptional regulator [Pseudovibrio stylochi]
MSTDKSPVGRKQNDALTKRIFAATCNALALNGYAGTNLAQIVKTANTSKQAIYRRWPNGKPELSLETLRFFFSRVTYVPAGTTGYQQELETSFHALEQALLSTPLGPALITCLGEPDLRPSCQLLLAEQRTFFRQIYLYWGQTQTMETQINYHFANVLQRLIMGDFAAKPHQHS